MVLKLHTKTKKTLKIQYESQVLLTQILNLNFIFFFAVNASNAKTLSLIKELRKNNFFSFQSSNKWLKIIFNDNKFKYLKSLLWGKTLMVCPLENVEITKVPLNTMQQYKNLFSNPELVLLSCIWNKTLYRASTFFNYIYTYSTLRLVLVLKNYLVNFVRYLQIINKLKQK